jgi:[ribosomal protein S5]-alanine N-acetyltransferase
MKPVLLTPNLTLAPFSPQDIPLLLEMDAEPRVNQYVGKHFINSPPTPADIEARAKRFEKNAHCALGVWAMVPRGASAPVGWVALKDLDQSEFIEVGYRMLPSSWGKGYATECTRRLLQYGFDQVGLTAIVGVTHPQNIASQKVLKKAGLTHRGKAHFYKMDVEFFALERWRWEANSQ